MSRTAVRSSLLRSAGLAAMLALLLVGCAAPQIRYATAEQTRTVVSEILDNARRLRGTLYGKPALVSFRFRDERGRDRRFIGHPALLLFRPPRCFLLEVRSALGPVVARIGSNDQRYWAWVDAGDTRKLWWGTWQALESGRGRDFYIPPDDLLDVLLLRRAAALFQLDAHDRPRLGPLLEYRGRVPWLIVQRLGDDALPAVRRVMQLRTRAPHLPVRLIDYTADGRVWMDATLGGYARLEGVPDGPWIARRFVIRWPQRQAEMRLDLHRVRLRRSDVPFCRFPARFHGEIEVLDEPPAGP